MTGESVRAYGQEVSHASTEWSTITGTESSVHDANAGTSRAVESVSHTARAAPGCLLLVKRP